MGQLSERIIRAIQQSTPGRHRGILHRKPPPTLRPGEHTHARPAVALAIEHGALGAKLSGAGGGGVVIALAPTPPRSPPPSAPASTPFRSGGLRRWNTVMSRTARARSHPNIALIKYWGERDIPLNLPAVSSLSVTLDLPDRHHGHNHHAGAHDRIVINGTQLADKAAAQSPGSSTSLHRPIDRAAWSRAKQLPHCGGSGFVGIGQCAGARDVCRLRSRPDRTRLGLLARQGSGSACRSLWGAGFAQVAPHPMDPTVMACRWPPATTGISRWWWRWWAAARSPSARRPAWFEPRRPALHPGRERRSRCGRGTSRTARRDFDRLGAAMERSTYKMHATMIATWPPIRTAPQDRRGPGGRRVFAGRGRSGMVDDGRRPQRQGAVPYRRCAGGRGDRADQRAGASAGRGWRCTPCLSTRSSPGKLVLMGEYAVLDVHPPSCSPSTAGCGATSTPVEKVTARIGWRHFLRRPLLHPLRQVGTVRVMEPRQPAEQAELVATQHIVAACVAAGRPATDAIAIHHEVQGSGSGIDVLASHGGMGRVQDHHWAPCPPRARGHVCRPVGPHGSPRRAIPSMECSRSVPLCSPAQHSSMHLPPTPSRFELAGGCWCTWPSRPASLQHPELRTIVDVAESLGGGAKPSGASGGDCTVAFFQQPADAERFRSAMRAHGLPCIPVQVAPGARHVTS